ncbi:MAG: hypothetical protein Q9198_006270 [Flavoplaca austrocitrina]
MGRPVAKGRQSGSSAASPSDVSMIDAKAPSTNHAMAGKDEDSEMVEQETPDYSDTSDTNPNTTASSVVGDAGPADGRKRRIEATQLRKSVFGKKHNRLDESKEDDSIRRFRYLLGLTDLFRHFIDASPNPRIKEIMAEIDRQNEEQVAKAKKSHARQGGAAGGRMRRTEQEEDAELLKDEKRGGKAETVFRDSPAFVQNGEMRDYQVAGLNWLVSKDVADDRIPGIPTPYPRYKRPASDCCPKVYIGQLES